MLEPQKPIIGIGTELPIGKVVAIKHDHVVVECEGRIDKVSFHTVERFV